MSETNSDNTISESTIDKKISDDKMLEDVSYPKINDPDFQKKLYEKREYYYNRFPEEKENNTYEDIKKYRDRVCNGEFSLQYQQNFLSNFINPYTPFNGVLIMHGTGTGKCHSYNTPILMYDGNIKKVQDITIGEYLMGDDSTPRLVTSLARGNDKMYKIIQENGDDFIVNSEHILCLKVANYPKITKNTVKWIDNNRFNTKKFKNLDDALLFRTKIKNEQVFEITVEAYLNLPDTVKKVLYMYKVPINFEEKLVEIDPYILGYWLGKDKDYMINDNFNKANNNDFMELNLLKQKHIPYKYKCNSRNIRLQILAGLIDSEYINLRFEFNCNDNILTKDIIYLVRSLGYKCSIKNDKYYITGVNINEISIYILQKKLRANYDKYILTTKFSVEYYKQDDYYGFTLDQNCRYLLGDFTVTHNTCSAVAIAETFIETIKKYDSKIYILVPGPLNKESWKKEIVKCTNNKYYPEDINNISDPVEKEIQKNKAINIAAQFYKIMSYRGFYKKVLGEKIIDKYTVSTKKTYRKTDEGEFERDLSIDRIEELNNTVLIVDEAHNITGNEYGLAVQKIINNSKNLKIVLLTATPMKNLADDVIELLNYLRPKDDKIQRDKIFTAISNYQMEIKPNGIEYLKKMAHGYVSHYRGMNPMTFAKQTDHGEIPYPIKFTPLVRCIMEKFQSEAYAEIIKTEQDSLERKSAAVANFALCALSLDKSDLIPVSGTDGLKLIRNQLTSNAQVLQTKLRDKFFAKDTPISNIIYDIPNSQTISGLIFKQPYLKNFSAKFDKCFTNLMQLVTGKLGSGTSFIYSNLVKSGIELFEQVLIQNGCLEYKENGDYAVNDDTIDYETGLPYKEFVKNNKRPFMPATYLKITGKSDENVDDMQDEKIKILDKMFSNVNNLDGKYIKFVLGSKVMNEGITLRNVKQVHILDVYFNLSKVYQVIGRAIRHCVHYDIMSEENPFPVVDVFRYTVKINDKELSAEEELYIKAEEKFLLIKKIERALKEVAIDCPLNYNGNIFKNEVIEYKDCVRPDKQNKDSTNPTCPAVCDFEKCDYICDNKSLNLKYYDKTRNIYKKIMKQNLDLSTFNKNLATSEINAAKSRIKKLYKINYVYTLDEIINYVKNTYEEDKIDIFDIFFVYRAIDELIPTSENDFNKFNDVIYDKYNIGGYIIHRNKYYIFQPFNQPEDVLMYYRSNYQQELNHELTVKQYLMEHSIFEDKVENIYTYSMDYYDNKPEYDYIGIIDKEVEKHGTDKIKDIFKIKQKRVQVRDTSKKKGIGISTEKGAACITYKDKSILIEIAKKINIKISSNASRSGICDSINKRLLYLEKYSTDKDKNKFTYFIIPNNHPQYSFPYNLEDRIVYIQEKINILLPKTTTYTVTKLDNGIFDNKRDKNLAKYKLSFKYDSTNDNFEKDILELGFKKDKDTWNLIIE